MQQFSENLRKGFMNLTIARYAMGPDRISPLQIPAAMVATVRVQGSLQIVHFIQPLMFA